MSMLCAISGTVPEHPTVSKKSGHVFERSLITNYVSETGKCPITGVELTEDDLLPLATNKTIKPRSSAATSIPGMLGTFHDEWDALMLEHHTLRQNLHTVRQELSHALYQHDAACRVIARLIRERDEARAALTTLREDMRAEMEAAAEARKRAGEEEEAAGGPAKRSKQEALGQDVIAVLDQTNAALSSGRRKRAVPEGTASVEQLGSYTLTGSFPLHKTTQPGITALALHPTQTNLLASCGADATVQLFDLAAQRQLPALTGHSKRVTAAVWGEDSLLLTASNDKTVRFWKHSAAGDAEEGAFGSWECAAVGEEHAGEVRGLALHPSRKYAVSVSDDASWAWWDLNNAACLKQCSGAAAAYTCTGFHPDGLLLVTGTADAKAQIWEMRQQKAVTGFEAGGGSPLSGVSFSENGYHVAAVAADGVSVWDLRKMKCIKELRPYDEPACRAVAFDASSQFLAVGGADLRVYAPKQDWALVKAFPDLPKKGLLSLAWGPKAGSILVGGGDHNLRKGLLSLAWGPKAGSILVGGGDHNLRVFGPKESGDAEMQG
ncbi:hypothetical protein OEZ86_004386 [Tetradesmus obliquus]|nr:hypothetical protein OEZ86_004386 [Tetradesmus obliquus]